jgi:2-methylcitrate dehydratase PrpD
MSADFEATAGAVDFIHDFDLSQAPAEVGKTAKVLIADAIGVTILGVDSIPGAAILSYASEFDGQPRGTVLGTGLRPPLPLAALANGTLSHADDFDDDEPIFFCGHPSAPVLSALVPLAGHLKSSGAELMAAFIVGSEVQGRIGQVVNPQHYWRGWHTTSTLGIMGATAACARLKKLDREATAFALATAGSFASGLKVNFGTPVKPLHVGRAAEGAIVATLLASRGFAAGGAVLDGDLGLLRVFSEGQGDERVEEAFGDLGERFALLDPGAAIKQYPCCSSSHPAIDATLALRSEHSLTESTVVSIACSVAPGTEEILIHPRPSTGLEAKFSLPYVLARALRDGSVDMDAFDDQAVLDPSITPLLSKVEERLDASLLQEGVTASTAATVTITTTTGETHTKTVWDPKGSPRNPVDWQSVARKFRACTEATIGKEHVDAALELITGLDELPVSGELFKACAPYAL